MPDRLNTARRALSWARVAPAVFLFVLPIAHTTPLRIACLVLSLVGLVATLGRHPAGQRLPGSLVVAMGVWICTAAAASFTSIEPSYSWGEFRNEVLSTVIAFAVFYRLTDQGRALRRWQLVLTASLALVVPLASLGYLGGGDWERGGWVGDRNAYSTYVVQIVPFLSSLWLVVARPWKPMLCAAIAATLLSGAFTQNRILWFAIATEFALFVALVWFRQPPELRRRRRGRVLAALGLASIVFIATLAFVVQQKAVVSRTSVEEQVRIDRDPRFAIWTYATERIRERPWVGHGFGRGILRSDFRTHFGDPLKWHGHNMLVDYWLEAGVFGALALVGLFAALASHAWRLYRSADPAIWPLGAWSLVMLAGIGLKVMTDDILVRDSSLLFWSLLGMSFGLASRLQRGGARPANAR